MKKIIIITIVAFTMIFTSCERVDFGTINQNPNAPTELDIDALMRGVLISYSQAGNRYYYSNAAVYAQYESQAAYPSAQLYAQDRGGWSQYYRNLNSFKTISNINGDVRGATTNYKAISELMSVLIWKRNTDTFGDVPYFEALQGANNISPAYTRQEDIYIDLIARAKAARDMIDPTVFSPDANTDIFYSGDMDKWGKFANSLILALTLQLSETSQAGMAQAEFNLALADSHGLMETVADDMVFTPDVTGQMTNPISKQRAADYNISKEMTDALKGNGAWGSAVGDTKNPTSTVGNSVDFRVYRYADGPGGDGLPYGYSAYSVSGVAMSPTLNGAGSSFTLFSSAYTWLNRAEGALIYASGENVNTMLTNGIVTSFSKHGLPTSAANSKATERIANVAGSVTMAQVIGEEKWFALFPDGNSAWAEQRRTGFPDLQLAPDNTNGGVLPQRMLYPNNENIINPNGYAQGEAALVPAEDKNYSAIWWAQ